MLGLAQTGTGKTAAFVLPILQRLTTGPLRRDGRYDILVATDIAARGIDVSEISHVINFDMPDTVDAYTHRIGRTGRTHKSGEAWTFVLPGDEALVGGIEKVLGAQIERRRLPGFDYGGFVPEIRPSQSGSNGPSRTPSNGRHNRGRSDGKSGATAAPRRSSRRRGRRSPQGNRTRAKH